MYTPGTCTLPGSSQRHVEAHARFCPTLPSPPAVDTCLVFGGLGGWDGSNWGGGGVPPYPPPPPPLL